MGETRFDTSEMGTVVVFPGSWETILRPEGSDDDVFMLDNWSAFRREMRLMGYSALVLDSLPSQDPTATPEDHAQAAITEIGVRATSPVVMFAGYSQGGLLVEPTLEAMEREGQDTKDILVSYITASLPKPSPEAVAANPLLAAVPEARSSHEFLDSVDVDREGLTSISREDAQRLLFERAGWFAGQLAVGNMRKTVRLNSSQLSLPAHLKHRTRYFFDPEEMVRNRDQVRALAQAYAADGFKVVEIPDAGHAIHVSKPRQLAWAMAEFAETDSNEIPTAELPRPGVPRQRTSADAPSLSWIDR